MLEYKGLYQKNPVTTGDFKTIDHRPVAAPIALMNRFKAFEKQVLQKPLVLVVSVTTVGIAESSASVQVFISVWLLGSRERRILSTYIAHAY